MDFGDLGKTLAAIGGGIILIIVGIIMLATKGDPIWLMPAIGVPFIGGGTLTFALLATGKI